MLIFFYLFGMFLKLFFLSQRFLGKLPDLLVRIDGLSEFFLQLFFFFIEFVL